MSEILLNFLPAELVFKIEVKTHNLRQAALHRELKQAYDTVFAHQMEIVDWENDGSDRCIPRLAHPTLPFTDVQAECEACWQERYC